MKRVLAWIVPGLAASAVSLWTWWSWQPALEALLGVRARWILAAPLAALLLWLYAVPWLARPAAPPGRGAVARVLLAGLGLSWLAFLVLVPEPHELWLLLALGPASGLVALVLLLELASASWRPAPARFARALCLAIALGPPCLEATLRVLSRLRPTPLLAPLAASPGRLLVHSRPRPGLLRMGFPCNSLGHYDDEFSRRKPGETRVAVIGDSFSQGVVPHQLHYTTLAERALGFAVDNFGVASIGLPEYEALLLDEALPLDPSLVVIAVFVGNDLEPPAEASEPGGLISWIDRRSVLVWLVPHRLQRMAEERRALGTGGLHAGAREPAGADETDLPQRWLADPLSERPTMSMDRFLSVEKARATVVCRMREQELEWVLQRLERMRRACAPRPLAVLLIPDEFQVEDALWESVRGEGLERDLAQHLLKLRLDAAGIPVLDLLPALRAAEPLADGNRHLYQLQDTHFNVRGNHVAGEALAAFVRGLLDGGR